MDSVEMENELKESTKISKVVEYGDEGLAAGPNIETDKELIVTEGRADVVNMLKHGIKNVIGMQGTRFPKTIATLGESKELTLFVDGDRGGNLIAQNVCENAKVVYIAQAPDGKEVEELAGKELLQALRKKVPAEVFLRKIGVSSVQKSVDEEISRRALNDEDISKLRELSSEMKGKNVLVLNEDLDVVQNLPSSRINSINPKDSFVLMVSNVTGLIAKEAEKLQVRAIAAKTFGKTLDTKIELVSL
tara:strand:- start:1158 stop:1898 length:741 start_codon:yes stop_codon:yes gene_type:complete